MIQKLKISIFDLAHPVDAAAVLPAAILHKQLGDISRIYLTQKQACNATNKERHHTDDLKNLVFGFQKFFTWKVES